MKASLPHCQVPLWIVACPSVVLRCAPRIFSNLRFHIRSGFYMSGMAAYHNAEIGFYGFVDPHCLFFILSILLLVICQALEDIDFIWLNNRPFVRNYPKPVIL